MSCSPAQDSSPEELTKGSAFRLTGKRLDPIYEHETFDNTKDQLALENARRKILVNRAVMRNFP